MNLTLPAKRVSQRHDRLRRAPNRGQIRPVIVWTMAATTTSSSLMKAALYGKGLRIAAGAPVLRRLNITAKQWLHEHALIGSMHNYEDLNSMKAGAQIEALVTAVLELQENSDLAAEQRFRAQHIYTLASSLETDLQADECDHVTLSTPHGKICRLCGVRL